ncbi:MAG: LA_2272 family surface repeat-containing protein [Bacteroidales bacterium]
MKTRQLIAIILATSAALTCHEIKAQENEKEPVQGSQITFAYPLGTNGIDAISVPNRFSVNVLYGINGGLDGLELGGIFNYNDGDVNGMQLAGVANINREHTSGLMWAGCFNLALDHSQGVQLADVNIATGDFTGVQAGVFNYAGGLRGVQFGLVNIVGEDNGAVPIGLINIVRGGYYELEFATSEVLYTNVNYKMGVEHFYTIFKLGSSRYESNPVYSFGLGFGSMLSLAEKHKISMDLSVNHIVYNEEWSSDDNCLSKFDLSYRFYPLKHVGVFAGPSFNWYVSETRVDESMGTLNIPANAHNFSRDNNEQWMWLGFNVGIAYRF